MPRSILAMIAALVAVAGLPSQDSRASEKDESRRYALPASLPERPPAFSFTSPPSWHSATEHTFSRTGDPEVRDPATDVAADVLRFVFRSQRGYLRRTRVESDSPGWLRVIGPRAAHDLVPGVLQELARVSSRRIEVELMSLPRGALAATSGALLDAPTVQRLHASNEVATVRAQLRPGVETPVESITRRASLRDYRLVAASRPSSIESRGSASSSADVVPLGMHASLRIDPMPGGDFVLTLEGQQSEIDEPVRSIVAKAEPRLIVDLPSVSWAAMSASARLPSGSAIVVGTDAMNGATWLIGVTATAIPEPPPRPSFQLLPVAGAVSGPLAEGIPTWGVRLSPDVFLDRIRTLGSQAPSTEIGLEGASIGPFIAALGSVHLVTRAAGEIRQLAEEATTRFNYEVVVRTVSFPDPAVAKTDGRRASAATYEAVARTSGIVGDRVVLIAGKSSMYLKDWDVEVAQDDFICDPMFDQVFTGHSMSIQAVRGAAGHALVDASLEYHELTDLATGESPAIRGIKLEVPKIASVTARVPVDVTLGEWTQLHTASVGGRGRQLVVMIRITEG